MPDTRTVQEWLDRYVRAWATYDPTLIASLYSEDAVYRWHPWDEGEAVARGRDRIVAAWLDERDEPGTWEARYEPLLASGDTAIATGRSRYYTDAGRSTLDREYWNIFVMRFDGEDRCSEFTE
jgi:ketosteroid isomerase-like protein